MRFKKKIKPVWENIYKIQELIDKKLRKYDKKYRDNVKMVSGELLENSVKYYMEKNIHKPVEFYFSNNNGIEISILNQKIEKEDVKSLTTLIDSIRTSVNPYNLLINRLQEILDNRVKGESRLGLLRVASDGGYSLSYIYNSDAISIYAKKSKSHEELPMEPLNYEDLTIEVTELDSYVKVVWKGKCRTLNPEFVLDTYLAKLAGFLREKRVVVTFDQLESMNSSTVPPLLTFIKTLEESGVNAKFLYDDREEWQRASFKPLAVIAGRYVNVKIEANSSHELV